MAASVLILTENDDLLDDLLRLCAAVDAEAEVVHGGPVPAAQWEQAPLVLAGDDWAAARPEGGPPPPRRSGVLLIARDLDDHTVWARGVAIGAELVLHLPDDERTLTDRIADAVEGRGRPALTIGVLGGRGGAGTSTLACALATSAAQAGHRTMLLDGDPLGGGLDLLLGAERIPGLRWPAFTAARGRLSGAALEEALPRPHGLSLLSWDRTALAQAPGEAMRSVLSAARRRAEVVVLDLPRTLDEATTAALAHLDLGLLLVPAELRAVAAARRTVDTSGALIRDLRVVARTAAPGTLAGPELARLLGLPLAGELPDEPGLTAACDAGEPPGADRRGALAGFCAELLKHAVPATAFAGRSEAQASEAA
jgi:secretion/DNA translocation related CpaE-like protein